MSDNHSDRRMTACASHAPGMARDTDGKLGQQFRAGMATLKQRIDEFDPELVVMFGVDHVRAYQPIVPAVSVVTNATGRGDAGSPTGTYDIDTAAVTQLAGHLLDREIDVAITHDAELDHGFGQTVGDLLGSLDARKIVPVYINCAEAPLMSCSRAVTIGDVIGQFFAGDPRRILFLATGGLSHAPPTLVHGARGLTEEERRQLNVDGAEAALSALNPEWDEFFLRSLEGTDTAWVAPMGETLERDGGVGANEVRSWLAAWAAGGKPLETVAYEPVREWITGMGVASSTN